jgi:hypothetical protein
MLHLILMNERPVLGSTTTELSDRFWVVVAQGGEVQASTMPVPEAV